MTPRDTPITADLLPPSDLLTRHAAMNLCGDHRIRPPARRPVCSLLPALLLIAFLPPRLSLAQLQCENNICFQQSSYEAVIPEDTPIGETVLIVLATSSNPVDTITYTLQTPHPGLFGIDNSTGSITLLGTPDVASYPSTVQVIDGPSTNVLIQVVAAAPPPSCSPLVLYQAVTEGQPARVRLNCTDSINSSSALAYSIDSGDDRGNFIIATSGELNSTGALDYETGSVYVLFIAVSAISGGSPVSTNVAVFIAVPPVNEYTPAFVGEPFEFEVNESMPVGHSIGQVVAQDSDGGYDGKVVYLLQPSIGSPFLLDQTSGELFLVEDLDLETTDTYMLSVVARDSALDPAERLEATASITIQVLSTNEHTPAFPQAAYYAQVLEECEGVDVGDELVRVNCSDGDSGADGEITYSILSGNDDGEFTIDTSTGSIALSSCLDLETGAEAFQLAVQCSDEGHPARTGDTVVFFKVMDVNEHLPRIQNDDIYTSIPENAEPGSLITQVVASDSDHTALLWYSMSHDSYCPEGIFRIDSTSGEIYLSGNVDYETGRTVYFCTATVLDGQVPARSSEGDITITVTNVNDKPPTCVPSFYAISILENLPVNSNVRTFSCDDPDSNTLAYTVASSVPSSLPFTLSSSGGHSTTLSLVSPLDAELQTTYHISLRVSDGDFETTLLLYVLVTGVDDNSPVFLSSQFTCNVSETAAVGASVCVAAAHDPDADGTLVYSIIEGNDEEVFEIDAFTGEIVLIESIDFETRMEYDLTVEVSDSTTVNTTSVHIDVLDSNEHAPTMEPLIFTTLAENALPGTTVTTIFCVDADDGNSSVTDITVMQVSAQLGPGSETILPDSPFSVDTLTGELLVNSMTDYETTQQYRIILVCHDRGVPPLQSLSTVIIELLPENEFQPSFPQPAYSETVAEDQPVGVSITQLSALDSDRGVDGLVVYSLMDPVPSFLAIDPYMGVLRVVQPIDCMSGTEYNVTVEARDEGATHLSSTTMLNLHITNCSLGKVLPSQAIYTASVSEEAPIGYSVLTVHCWGSKELHSLPSGLQYRHITQPGVVSPFAVDPAGSISVSQTLDYESSTSHMIEVECYDPQFPSSSATISVYVSVLPINEHPPTFSQPVYNVTVSEGSPLASIVAQIRATDGDSGQDGELLYSLVDTSGTFRVDPVLGNIYLTSLLDREGTAGDDYTLALMVQDSSIQSGTRMSATTQIRVHVLDANDNRPQCDRAFYHVILTPLTPVGAHLVTLNCSDADLGDNAKLVFSFASEPLRGQFSINEASGELTLKGSEVKQTATVFSIPVTVRDSGVPPLSTTVTLVADVRDSAVATIPDKPPDNHDLPVEVLRELEGERNAANMILPGITLAMWKDDDTVQGEFQMAVARSVTYYCALDPLECSLVSGCAEFFGTSRRRETAESFASFLEPDVVLLPGYPRETSPADLPNLELLFYVSLPPAAPLSPVRKTDFVVPGDTLGNILQRDSDVISAQVQVRVQESSTPRAGHWRTAAIAGGVTTAIFVPVFLVTLTVCGVHYFKQWRKKKDQVVLIGRESPPASDTLHNGGHMTSNWGVPSTPSKDMFMQDFEYCRGNGQAFDREATPSSYEYMPSSMEGNAGGTCTGSEPEFCSLSPSPLQPGEARPGDHVENWPFSLPGTVEANVRQGPVRTQLGWGSLRH